jgi:hypothetical protein
MQEIGPIVAVVAVVAAVVLSLVWHFGRSESLVQRWAECNGYRLINHEYCWFYKGPFFWTTSKNQTVYRVTVEDGTGYQRTAWVRCGGWFLGLMSDHVDVRWDD